MCSSAIAFLIMSIEYGKIVEGSFQGSVQIKNVRSIVFLSIRMESSKLTMSSANTELLKLCSYHMKSMVFRCFMLVMLVLVFDTVIYPFTGSNWLPWRTSNWIAMSAASNLQHAIWRDKFLEIPQIIWGLNNQKIALARACLTNSLMPSLSASLFYKEAKLLKPMAFDKKYQFEKFNSLSDGFVQLGRCYDLLNHSKPFEIQKGSIKDYAKIFESLVVVDEIENEVAKVISKIREVGNKVRYKPAAAPNEEGADSSLDQHVAVHMRIEKDRKIHSKKLEQKLRIEQICSGKEVIIEKVSQITGIQQPAVDDSILSGWKHGLLPIEKQRLGVRDIRNKYPYLVHSAIDYEVCSRAYVLVGNNFSTFSSLVLSRTL
ncbi:hypothetical protein MUK42_26660, partial [Musa troglodytarum]